MSKYSSASKFVMKLGESLSDYGAHAYHIEKALTNVSSKLKLDGSFLSYPTSILASFEAIEEYHIKRVGTGRFDLSRLSDADHVADLVLEKKLTPEEGTIRLKELRNSKEEYSTAIHVLAYGIASASFSVFFYNSLSGIILSFLLGIIAGLYASLVKNSPRFKGTILPFVGFFVSFCAIVASLYDQNISSQLVIVSGLIVFLPGIGIILSLQELSTRNLISGTARVAGAFVDLVKMAFGVLLASQLLKNFNLHTINTYHAEIHPIWLFICLFTLAPAVAVIFNAKVKDVKWIVVASVIGFLATKYGVAFMGPKIGYIFPGFCIAAFSNYIARKLDQPASITILPGMYYMVPGSVGFKTIQFLLFDRFSDFLHSSAALLFISISLVAGISFGNIMVPPRRSL